MKLGLAITLTNEVKFKSTIIGALSDDLKSHFQNKNYGADIKSFTVGITCVSPQFLKFFKEKAPKYTKGKKTINPDGIPITVEDSFEYGINMDFESFKIADEEESKKMIAIEILESLVVFDKMKSKIKDFDMDSFKADIEGFFKSHNLI